MYQIILIVIVLAAIAWILWLVRIGRIENKTSKKVISDNYYALQERLRFKDKAVITNLRLLSYQLSLLFFALLVLSSYLPVILTGDHLSGLALIIHVTVAPLFCISLAASAVFWAQKKRFSDADSSLLKDKSFSKIFTSGGLSPAWEKVIFWLFLIFSVPAILSIVLSMYPLFGSEGQEFLLQTHRYTTLILFLLATIHTLAVIKKQSIAEQKESKTS